MIKPPYLLKGDTVGILATARYVNEDYISFSKEVFESWGLKVVYGKHLFDKYHRYAGKDQSRASDLQMMLDDPKIKAIVCRLCLSTDTDFCNVIQR